MEIKKILFLVGIHFLLVCKDPNQTSQFEEKTTEEKIKEHHFCPTNKNLFSYNKKNTACTNPYSYCLEGIIPITVAIYEKRSFDDIKKDRTFKMLQRLVPLPSVAQNRIKKAYLNNDTDSIKRLDQYNLEYYKKNWKKATSNPFKSPLNIMRDMIDEEATNEIKYEFTKRIDATKELIKEYGPRVILAFGGLHAAKFLYSFFKEQIHKSWKKIIFSWSFSPYNYRNTKKLSELYGYSSIKRYMKDIIALLKEDKRKRVSRNYEGIIFYGPPGCGKTTFAYALGAEVNAKLFTISIRDILSDTANGINKIELIFDKIASLGKKEPVILLLDEIDLLIPSRNKEVSQEEKKVLQLFLTYIDGNKVDKSGVMVVGCTNKYDELDPALKRFGRMGVSLAFPLPDKAATIELIEEIILKNEKMTFEDQDFLIDKLEGKTTAEIVALLLKIQNKIKKNNKKYITNSFLLEEIF